MNSEKKMLVTIITGFLGSGKTTFINDVLKNNPKTKFALVENEFGEVSIDSKLIKGVNASQMFELKNGCICCTITDEYEKALAEIALQFHDVEHLLIETSGVADPGPVIAPFFRDSDLKKLYRFNGTVCLVDAKYFDKYPAKKIAFSQLAVANTVIITKTEAFSEIQKEQFFAEIKKLNPFAGTQLSVFGNIPGFDIQNMEHKIKHVTDFTTLKTDHEYLQTKTIKIEKPLDREQFSEWFSYNFDLYKSEVYRIKGILCFENEPYLFVLQGVGGSFEITESDLFAAGIKSEIVLIGQLKNINFQYLY
jgi:G3E family GTPase